MVYVDFIHANFPVSEIQAESLGLPLGSDQNLWYYMKQRNIF